MGGGGKKFNTKKKGITNMQLGRALCNSSRNRELNFKGDHLLNVICDNYNELNHKSIVEVSSLDEYLSTSLKAQENYDRGYIQILTSLPNNPKNNTLLKRDKNCNTLADESVPQLSIPRRPLLLVGPSCSIKTIPLKEELEKAEKNAFLYWRKGIAEKEEKFGFCVTPFEKNLEFWRQLWRTIEKSHVIVEIVDGRDPLFFRNKDLELYIKEIDPFKQIVLLINKADFLSIELRQEWLKYFKLNVPSIRVFFFSALNEINNRETDKNISSTMYAQVTNNLINEPKEYDIFTTLQLLQKLQAIAMSTFEKCKMRYENCISYKIYNNKPNVEYSKNCFIESSDYEMKNHELSSTSSREDSSDQSSLHDSRNYDGIEEDLGEVLSLNNFFDKELVYKNKKLDPLYPGNTPTIGMIGFPNVGKSSVVNALFGHHQLSISQTPGKTRHIQTLKIQLNNMLDKVTENISIDELKYNIKLGYLTLCDCPGLVMPSFVSTKEHLLINGVTSLDHYKGNFLNAIQILCDRIPNKLYDLYFGETFDISRHLDSKSFLTKLCESRHLYQQGKGGIADWNKAGRMVLRDYWSGKLLFCKWPPTSKNIYNNDNDDLKINRSIQDQFTISDSDSNNNDIDLLAYNIVNNEIKKNKTKRQVRMDIKRSQKGKLQCKY
ncbi:hypothetical protein cand_002500 [Cryptosporidium andersoni]|uniref:CP-type G domain-containing protein n=1 Tax=Cryptosporidium andersoni TaxID=117008 RepID=A0A1J4MPE2_9CRYT|nr:hypothetical protein cand_002500 [Cryptosporidium andersoni]